MRITNEKVETAFVMLFILNHKGFLTDGEYSKLKDQLSSMYENECGWFVETNDRSFTLIVDEDCSSALVMKLITDGITYNLTHDKRHSRVNIDILEYEKLLENFYAKI